MTKSTQTGVSNSASFILSLIIACTTVSQTVTANDTITFVEDFALAKNREAILEQLIPGTKDYYYYHALHYQNEQQWDKLASIMEPWVKRHGETSRVWEIRNREALLRYGENNKKTIDYLKRRLGLSFNHQQDRLNAKPNLPVQLDQDRISWQTFLDRAFQQSRQLGGVLDSALDRILRDNIDLSGERRRELLSRLVYPDYERLAGLIAADLRTKESRGFGEFAIHRNLLPKQLDELVKLRPELATNTNFVHTRIHKLSPNEDVNWKRNIKAREAYLVRIWNYVNTLDPAFNSLKAHSLYQLLSHYRSKGEYPAELWMTYLKLPRPVPYIEPRYINSPEGRRHQVDMNANYLEVTMCPPIRNDQELVREYLLHALENAGSYEAYQPYIEDTYLKTVFAEAKLTKGKGDPERWYSLLHPSQVQQLKDRIDILFAPTNTEQFLPADGVVLNVDIKNVPDLVVKLYEINTLNYFLDKKEDINTDLNLDGLVPNQEWKYHYDEVPITRHRRSFSFDTLRNKRGNWIIEFIGNGVSSRALVRKGSLQYLSRHTAAGTMVKILDQSNIPAKDPALWFGGRKYEPDEDGNIFLPFSKSGNQEIVLTDGDFATFEQIHLPPETYTLQAGFHIERETLIGGGEGALAVRPSLLSNGRKTDIDLLEEVKLLIQSTDLDGIESVQEIPDFQLFPDKESIHTFQVPRRLRGIRVSLEGKVSQVSTGGSDLPLTDHAEFEVNGIDQTSLIADLHLARFKDNYIVEVLGKSGEALPDRGVNCSFLHKHFRNPINVSLKSDQNGQINLGPLRDIKRLQVSGNGFESRAWNLRREFTTVRDQLHSSTGQVIEIPLSDQDNKFQPEDLVIMEVRRNSFVGNHFAKTKLEDGILEVRGLPRGNYEVFLRDTSTKIELKVTESTNALAGFALSDYRHLELRDLRPLQIAGIKGNEETIDIALRNSSPSTRLHVYGTRFLPGFSMAHNLMKHQDQSLATINRGSFESRYLSGRDIGEEYRYIIERRSSKRFPGNMAPRPGLILNPWALRETDTSIADARRGQAYRKSKESSKSTRSPARPKPASEKPAVPHPNSPNLDFLPSIAQTHWNLQPDPEGKLSLKRSDFGDRQQIHIVAIDDNGLAYRQIALDSPKDFSNRDLRLRRYLPPEKHFSQRRSVTLLRRDKVLEVADLRSSKLETYDTLSGIYSVLSGLASQQNPSGAKTFREFSFILDWPNLKPEEKRELYSKYACHELSFFIARRDPPFFEQVIKPCLANKRDKTFLDHYLLGNDLRFFLEPWRFGRLNIVERILLGQQLGGDESKAITRTVKDWFDLLPSDPEKADHLYQSALLGRRIAGRSAGRLGGGGVKKNGVMVADTFGFTPPAPAAQPAKPTARGASHRSLQLGKMLAARDSDGVISEGKEESLARERLSEEQEPIVAGAKLQMLRQRALGEALYRKLDPTREWAENNYYHLPIARQTGDLITANDFWNDYATWDGENGFYSRNFPSACRNFAEMMLAMSVMDLPFTAKKHDLEIKEQSLRLTAKSPLVVFHQEIEEREPAPEKPDILISQNFFRGDDRFETVAGERIDKFVTKEFLTGVLYGSQIVITNPNSSSQKLDVLLQVPEGAIPAQRSDYTKTYPIHLAPFSTRKVETHFYFPNPSGKDGFAHYPVHVAKNESPIAWATPFRFKVVNELSDLDKASWEYLSQYGTEREVLNYLSENNVHFIDLNRIAWRMRQNVDFFRKTTALLRNRFAYTNTLWSYGIFHNDQTVTREYLTQQEQFLRQAGKRLDCELVSINPVERHWYQHLEYSPLVNARSHRLGRNRKILNDRFHEQYHEYMKVLSYTPKLDPDDKLGVAYFLFLQDRVEEALQWFSEVNKENIESQLQYDYLSAYAALYREDPALAARITDQYRNYGVERWRDRFVQLGDQVKEITGADQKLTDREDRDQKQDQLASKQPGFELETVGSTININYRNLEEITINYYEMDLEFLFSSQPFVSGGSGQFSYIRPNFSEKKALPEEGNVIAFQVPNRFEGRNVLVETVAAGQKKSSAVYANSLRVQMAENYGRIEVRDRQEGGPLGKTYVKVYARYRDGSISFFKDGYTDLRGKFDYVSLNTDKLAQVEKFSVMIMSEKHGALVKEADPPGM